MKQNRSQLPPLAIGTSLLAIYKQEEPCEVGPPMRETFKHGSVGMWG